jgi:hypothetical protein
MKTILLEEWLADLRNPEVQALQGFGKLYNPETEKYCCLGRAAKLAQSPLLQTGSSECLNYPQEGLWCSDLPEPMWGREGRTVRLGLAGGGVTAVTLNDLRRLTFAAIADWLEAAARYHGWRPTQETERQVWLAELFDAGPEGLGFVKRLGGADAYPCLVGHLPYEHRIVDRLVAAAWENDAVTGVTL